MGVKLKLSKAFETALGAAEAEKLVDWVRKGLAELAKTNAAAKDLLESGQTIHVVCFSDKKAKKKGLEKPQAFARLLVGPGATAGDFGADKKPRKDGTAVIAIGCREAGRHGLEGLFRFRLVETTLLDVVFHELLHATNADRRHGEGEDLAIYEKWVRDFSAAILRAHAPAPAPPKKAAKKKKKKKKNAKTKRKKAPAKSARTRSPRPR